MNRILWYNCRDSREDDVNQILDKLRKTIIWRYFFVRIFCSWISLWSLGQQACRTFNICLKPCTNRDWHTWWSRHYNQVCLWALENLQSNCVIPLFALASTSSGEQPVLVCSVVWERMSADDAKALGENFMKWWQMQYTMLSRWKLTAKCVRGVEIHTYLRIGHLGRMVMFIDLFILMAAILRPEGRWDIRCLVLV